MARLLSDEDGIKTIAHVENGDLTIERQFDNTAAVNAIREIRSVTDGKGKEMYYAGSIPVGVVEGYLVKRGINFQEFMADPMHVRALMNDSDYADLRVWGGRL